MRVPTGIVSTIDFSEDGKHALISTERGPRIIPLDTEDLLTIARSRLTRGFTPSECAQFFPDVACPTLDQLKAGWSQGVIATLRRVSRMVSSIRGFVEAVR